MLAGPAAGALRGSTDPSDPRDVLHPSVTQLAAVWLADGGLGKSFGPCIFLVVLPILEASSEHVKCPTVFEHFIEQIFVKTTQNIWVLVLTFVYHVTMASAMYLTSAHALV